MRFSQDRARKAIIKAQKDAFSRACDALVVCGVSDIHETSEDPSDGDKNYETSSEASASAARANPRKSQRLIALAEKEDKLALEAKAKGNKGKAKTPATGPAKKTGKKGKKGAKAAGGSKA